MPLLSQIRDSQTSVSQTRLWGIVAALALLAAAACGDVDDAQADAHNQPDAGALGEDAADAADTDLQAFEVVIGRLDGEEFEPLDEEDMVILGIDTEPTFPEPIYAELALLAPEGVPGRFFSEVQVSWEDPDYDSTFRRPRVDFEAHDGERLCPDFNLIFYEDPFYLTTARRIDIDLELSAPGWRGHGQATFYVIFR